MKMLFLLLVCLSLPGTLTAKPKRSHGAHVHGAAKLDIAIEGDHASVQVLCDTHSLFGFEHTAKTPNERAMVSKTMKVFNESFGSMLVFESRLGCEVHAKQVRLQPEGHDDDDDDDHDEAPGEQHQSLFADYDIKCKKAIEPSAVQVDFSRSFPKIVSINLQVVSDRNTLSQAIKGKDGINLK